MIKSTPFASLAARWSLTAALALAAGPALSIPAAIELPGARAFPESITSVSDGTVYVGSLGAGGIHRIAPHAGKAEEWIKPGAYGSHSIFGVLADERSHTLWACSNDLSAMGVKVLGSDAPGSFLKGFDLKTGEGKVSVQLPGSQNLCNDIVVGKDGALYVTNTMSPQILRLAPGAQALEVWFSDPSVQPAASAPGLDGIAFGSDGNLYVNTYGPGDLYRIDVVQGKAGKLTKLKPSRPLKAPDAMRSLGGGKFLLIEGGGSLDTLSVNGDVATVTTLKDGFSVPTSVTLVGQVAYVSEGQLNYVFDPSKQAQQPPLPFHVFTVAVGH